MDSKIEPPPYTPGTAIPHLPYPIAPPGGQAPQQYGTATTQYPYPQQPQTQKFGQMYPEGQSQSPYPYQTQGNTNAAYTGGPGGGQSQIPPIGFYIPPTNSQTPIMQQQVPLGSSGGTGDDDGEPKYTNYHDDISGFEFSDKNIRRGFIRKVYSILSLQLGATVGCIALFLYHQGIKEWTQKNPGFLFGTLGVYIVTILALACCDGIRRKFPMNVIFLSIFTLATSVLVGSISSTYSENTVLLAAGITTFIVVALTIFSFQTKWDFTRFNGILFTCLLVFVLLGFMMIFLRSYFQPLRMIYAGAGALLFSAFLVHDTQLMLGGDHKYSISPEEYIFAALNLYLDIINIFLYILQILGRNN